MFAQIATNRDDYGKFFEQFGKCFKTGFWEDPANGGTMAELLMFKASQSGNEQISWKEYVGRTKKNQTYTYRTTFESLAVVSTTPVTEPVNKKRFGCVVGEENAVQQLKDFDGQKLKSALNEDMYLGDENEE